MSCVLKDIYFDLSTALYRSRWQISQIEIKARVGGFMAALTAAVMHDSGVCIRIRSSNYTGQFNDPSEATTGHHLATVLSGNLEMEQCQRFIRTAN